jgi:hypothetical protein
VTTVHTHVKEKWKSLIHTCITNYSYFESIWDDIFSDRSVKKKKTLKIRMWQTVDLRPIPHKISFIYLQSADRSNLHRTGWSSRLNKLYTLVWEEIVEVSRKQSVFLREHPETRLRATLNFKAVGKYSYTRIKDWREQRRITEYSRKVGGSRRLRSSWLTMCSYLPWRMRQQIFRKVGTFPSDYTAFHPTTP